MNIESEKSNKVRQGVLKSTGTVGGWTLASRVLGFVRDILLARVLGAGIMADAFFVAFKLPNFFRRLFAEGTLTVAMVPVLSDQRQQGEEDVRRYLNALAGLLLAILLGVTILGIVFMPALLMIFAPGFLDEPDRWKQTLTLARLMFPYLMLISLTAMAWAVLNTYKKFAVAAATPALLNLSLILAALLLAPGFENPALALAIGVLLGGALQLGIQFPALRRIGWTPRPAINLQLAAVKLTLKLFGPAVLGVAAVQVNILVGTVLATLLPAGAVSYLYYADRLVQLPFALFGMATGTALLPSMSRHFSSGNRELAIIDLRQGLGWLTWITLPSVIGLLILAEPIIVTLFEHGRFDHASSLATAHALQAYSLGLLAFCWIRVLSAACYAEKDAKSPVRFAGIAVAVNIVLALLLMWPLQYVGLALATSLASFVNAGLLMIHLRKRYGVLIDSESGKRMLRAVVACIPMLASLLALAWLWPFPSMGKTVQAMWLIIAVSGGALVFLLTARLLGERVQKFRADT